MCSLKEKTTASQQLRFQNVCYTVEQKGRVIAYSCTGGWYYIQINKEAGSGILYLWIEGTSFANVGRNSLLRASSAHCQTSPLDIQESFCHFTEPSVRKEAFAIFHVSEALGSLSLTWLYPCLQHTKDFTHSGLPLLSRVQML